MPGRLTEGYMFRTSGLNVAGVITPGFTNRFSCNTPRPGSSWSVAALTLTVDEEPTNKDLAYRDLAFTLFIGVVPIILRAPEDHTFPVTPVDLPFTITYGDGVFDVLWTDTVTLEMSVREVEDLTPANPPSTLTYFTKLGLTLFGTLN